MKTNLRGRDFISTQEWSKEELETVLQLAFDLKMKWGLDLPTRLLEDKTLFMLFFFSSTRTRNSFEAGMTRLGGHAIFLEPDKMQISHGDTPKEIGKISPRMDTASPSAIAIGARAINTCATWPNTPACQSSTCSAISTIPARLWPTS